MLIDIDIIMKLCGSIVIGLGIGCDGNIDEGGMF